MQSEEPAESCPSNEKKKVKVKFLLAVLVFAGRVAQTLRGINMVWEWMKPYCGPIWDFIKNHLNL